MSVSKFNFNHVSMMHDHREKNNIIENENNKKRQELFSNLNQIKIFFRLIIDDKMIIVVLSNVIDHIFDKRDKRCLEIRRVVQILHCRKNVKINIVKRIIKSLYENNDSINIYIMHKCIKQ